MDAECGFSDEWEVYNPDNVNFVGVKRGMGGLLCYAIRALVRRQAGIARRSAARKCRIRIFVCPLWQWRSCRQRL
jgi:hypothetical protein